MGERLLKQGIVPDPDNTHSNSNSSHILNTQRLRQLLHPPLPPLNLIQSLLNSHDLPIKLHPFLGRPDLRERPRPVCVAVDREEVGVELGEGRSVRNVSLI